MSLLFPIYFPKLQIKLCHLKRQNSKQRRKIVDKLDKIVINWHITEKCNYSCKHCFVKYAKCSGNIVSYSMQNSQKLLRRIYESFKGEYSKIRLNIAGGEPLLVPNLSFIISETKNIGFEVSLISNASYLGLIHLQKHLDSQKWIERNARDLSMFGISIDSLREDSNAKIGRYCLDKKTPKTLQEWQILKIAKDLRQRNENLKIKINTVVTSYNYEEYFGDFISTLKPQKWKVLQTLSISTQKVFCTDLQYKAFLDRHKKFADFITAESKSQMTNSYIMLDCFGRFYQNEDSIYSYSPCVLEMGKDEILHYAQFDRVKFQSRYKTIA